MNEKLHGSHVGYTTKEALFQLKDDINSTLFEYTKKIIRTKTSRIKDITSVSSNTIVISGITYCVTSFFGLIVLLKFICDPNRAEYSLLVQALLLWLFVAINIIIAFQEDYLREQEIPSRVQHAMASIDETAEHALWKEIYYPHLCAPFSPCVTLQWTYRDGTIVNLPWALLVRGDIIILRPGQEVPGRCESLEPGGRAFLGGQVFQYQNQVKETFTKPRCRSPHKNKMYRMIETPYLKNLTMALEQATSRPATVFNKKLNMCTMKLMERKVLPIAILIVFIINFLLYFALPSTSHWTDVYIEQVVASTLPLLQLIFPLAWVALNCYGMAKFKRIAEISKRIERTKSCSISEETEDPLLKVLSEPNTNVGHIKSMWTKFYLIATGKEDMVTRTSNIIHVLGSLTALCCVDKKGILSWPNPTAEKVFFLRNSGPLSKSSSKTSFVGSVGHLSQCQTPDQTSDWNKPTSDVNNCSLEPTTIAEVLDLTHDQNAAFRVEFDDQAWHEHLARLKPLGLAALLNTCAPSARRKYSEFCAHLTCEAQLSEDLVPVTNRRCLCELAKQIGFTESATHIYNLQENIATFRHLQADTIRRETRFARSLHMNTRVKVPLPHMLGVIVKDPARQLQLLCQGTADIVLDSCIDFWNGNDLSPISPSDRKKILDFYQRSSLTAYCTAFSYKPLTHGITRECANMYLELPADSRQLYAAQPTSWNEPREPLGGHFHSTDSLLCTDTHEEDTSDADGFFELQCNQVFIGMVTMQYQAQSDMVELIERLERACVRFVHFSKENELRSRVFSEKMGLESGWNCHISLASDTQSKPASPTTSQNIKTPCKENIWQNDADHFNSSLKLTVNREMSNPDNLGNSFLINSSKLSKTRILSLSAPGAINLEHSTVKFENEVKLARHSITTHNSEKTETVQDPSTSEDSLLGAWGQSNEQEDTPPEGCRSLSCLTDSTEHSAPVNFDMSNRAKLPRGIENIRPHIEQVDNVPLLVSLFTDCTASTARTMLSLMQDYGEVVAVMGSAANNHNMEIFLQADASVAVEPLYPVLCQKIPPYQVPTDCAGPIDLARSLNSIPCSLSMRRDADVSLFTLVSISRHYMTCLWNAIQFWMYALCAISFLQILALACGLPLALPTGLTMWLSFVTVSAISVSLVFAPLDPSIMHRPATKHQTTVDLETVLFAICYYCCKFIPTMIVIVVEYGLTIRSFCEQIASVEEDVSCTWVYPVRVWKSGNSSLDTSDVTHEWLGWQGTFSDGYYLSQHICLALITVHLVVISISFVHRDSSIWQKYFWTNIVWCVTVMAIAIMQSILSFILLRFVYSNTRDDISWLKYTVPWPISILYVMSPIFIFILNEFIKWLEIKANSRYQRRARLDFGTKLGMNSPF